jgi:hypothetical protein
MKRLAFGAITTLILLLVGCAHQAEHTINCGKIDWQSFGDENGQQGKELAYLSEAFPSCGQNIVIDKAAYQQGWHSGLLVYCTPMNGYQRGIDGHAYTGFCPGPLNLAFQAAYKQGASDFQQLLTVKMPYFDAHIALKKLYQSKQQIQQRLGTVVATYNRQPFSPETQYKIQKMKILIQRLSKKRQALQTRLPVLKQKYEKMRDSFLNDFELSHAKKTTIN